MSRIPATRWIVLAAAALAAMVLAVELATSEELAIALGKALLTAAGVIGIGGVSVRMWSGAVVSEARLPGGTGGKIP